ncbi:MAG TPA: DUF6165 family protein [Verrucomicrobiae bacterium]|nr:DUF6165 family protein [Verrucomicrobiae bacterium]
MAITVTISPGELLDRLTILEIKLERMKDQAKLKNVRHEHDLTAKALAAAVPTSPELSRLRGELKAVNEELWVIEDDIRDHERARNFDARFIELARAVYHTNDRRAAVKREINELLKSALVEEKSYAAY